MKKIILTLSAILLICETSFAYTCQPQKDTAEYFGTLEITALNSNELSYTVTQITDPGKPGEAKSFSAKALTSTRAGYVQYSDDSQSNALDFWGSWDAPGDKITYDVQDSVLEGKDGVIEVWGVEAPADNPTIDGSPGIMGAFNCK